MMSSGRSFHSSLVQKQTGFKASILWQTAGVRFYFQWLLLQLFIYFYIAFLHVNRTHHCLWRARTEDRLKAPQLLLHTGYSWVWTEERAHGQSCWLLQELLTMTSQLLCFQCGHSILNTVIIFTLQHRNPYPFADQFSSTTALLLLTKALQIDSHTFITQLGAPASNTPGLCITIVTVFPGNISLCGEGCLCSTEPWLWAGWQSLPHPSPHTQAQHIAPLDSHSSCHGGIRWCEQLICSSQYPQQQHNCTKTSATAMAETSSPRGAERRHSGQTRSMNGKALPR